MNWGDLGQIASRHRHATYGSQQKYSSRHLNVHFTSLHLALATCTHAAAFQYSRGLGDFPVLVNLAKVALAKVAK